MLEGWCLKRESKDLEAIQALRSKTPSTIGEVCKLLGFLSYYRMYIQNFSKVAEPMYELLQARHPATVMPQPRTKMGKGAQLPSRTPMQCREEHQYREHLIS